MPTISSNHRKFKLYDFNVYDKSNKDSTGNSDNESMSSNDSRDKKLSYTEQL